MLSWWRFQWMINDQNGSCLMLGWSPSFASCGAWNSMLWYANCLPRVLIGSVPRKKPGMTCPKEKFWCVLVVYFCFFCFGKVLSVGALDQLVEHDWQVHPCVELHQFWQCQLHEILFKIGPEVHMRTISTISKRRSKKIPGRRLSIVPSSCARVFC